MRLLPTERKRKEGRDGPTGVSRFQIYSQYFQFFSCDVPALHLSYFLCRKSEEEPMPLDFFEWRRRMDLCLTVAPRLLSLTRFDGKRETPWLELQAGQFKHQPFVRASANTSFFLLSRHFDLRVEHTCIFTKTYKKPGRTSIFIHQRVSPISFFLFGAGQSVRSFIAGGAFFSSSGPSRVLSVRVRYCDQACLSL